jgi:hypothetical protein
VVVMVEDMIELLYAVRVIVGVGRGRRQRFIADKKGSKLEQKGGLRLSI